MNPLNLTKTARVWENKYWTLWIDYFWWTYRALWNTLEYLFLLVMFCRQRLLGFLGRLIPNKVFNLMNTIKSPSLSCTRIHFTPRSLFPSQLGCFVPSQLGTAKEHLLWKLKCWIWPKLWSDVPHIAWISKLEWILSKS